MAVFPTPQGEQPPPDLPAMPDVSETLSNYLRTFALWCRRGFADRMPAHAATAGIMLMANDAPAGTSPPVFLVQVNSAGAIVATRVSLGGGQP
jgi:hypothetical protein